MTATAERLAELARRYDAPRDAARRLSVLVDHLAKPEAPTSVHDPGRVVDVHIADSLSGLAVEQFRAARLIADLGAGAGLPGLVLAAVLPGAHLVSVESTARKCAFIESAAAAMGLTNVEVVCARAEEWLEGTGRCDIVCARALAALPVLCEYAAPLLRAGGALVAWKGVVGDVEAADAAAAAERLGLALEQPRQVVPFAGAERRTLHVARKVAPTPPGFPRRPGMATKRPLSATTLRRQRDNSVPSGQIRRDPR